MCREWCIIIEGKLILNNYWLLLIDIGCVGLWFLIHWALRMWRVDSSMSILWQLLQLSPNIMMWLPKFQCSGNAAILFIGIVSHRRHFVLSLSYVPVCRSVCLLFHCCCSCLSNIMSVLFLQSLDGIPQKWLLF